MADKTASTMTSFCVQWERGGTKKAKKVRAHYLDSTQYDNHLKKVLIFKRVQMITINWYLSNYLCFSLFKGVVSKEVHRLPRFGHGDPGENHRMPERECPDARNAMRCHWRRHLRNMPENKRR